MCSNASAAPRSRSHSWPSCSGWGSSRWAWDRASNASIWAGSSTPAASVRPSISSLNSRVQSHPEGRERLAPAGTGLRDRKPDLSGDLGLPDLRRAAAEEHGRCRQRRRCWSRGAGAGATKAQAYRPRRPPHPGERRRRRTIAEAGSGAEPSAHDRPRPAGADDRVDLRDERDHRLRAGHVAAPEGRQAPAQDANDQILLARDAYATQSYAIVATSLQAYLALSPNMTKAQRKQLRQQIVQFQLLARSSSSGSGISPTP